jgi:hypothetical protein
MGGRAGEVLQPKVTTAEAERLKLTKHLGSYRPNYALVPDTTSAWITWPSPRVPLAGCFWPRARFSRCWTMSPIWITNKRR